MHGTTFLKVKIKALAAEARIIRFQERKSVGDIRSALSNHRRGDVRRAARETLLAYGYLRGRTYAQVEASTNSTPNWKRVAAMVKRYGPFSYDPTPLEDWATDARTRPRPDLGGTTVGPAVHRVGVVSKVVASVRGSSVACR